MISFDDSVEVRVYDVMSEAQADAPIQELRVVSFSNSSSSLAVHVKSFIDACYQQFCDVDLPEDVCTFWYIADRAVRECFLLLQFQHFELAGMTDRSEHAVALFQYYLSKSHAILHGD